MKTKISIPDDWMQKQVTLEEAENAWDVAPESPRWIEFKEKFGECDELWQYSSSRGSWLSLGGRAGYCILRGKKIVAAIGTRMS